MHNRYESLDIIRGFALLGLPLMNIVAFSMPFAAYSNPTVYLSDTWLNHEVFIFLQLFASQKFVSLFSMLFGASCALLVEKHQAMALSAGWLHVVRMGWLFLLGYLHLSYLWIGDILYLYALTGLMLYPLIRLSTQWLFIIFLGLFCCGSVLLNLEGINPENIGFSAYREFAMFFQPTADEIQQELALYRSGYWDIQAAINSTDSTGIVSEAQQLEALRLYFQFMLSQFLHVLSLMCLGVYLYRSGILLGNKSSLFYQRLAWVCLLLGMSLTAFGVWQFYAHDWSLDLYFSYGLFWGILGALITALAYMSLLILWMRQPYFSAWRHRLADVGRMALTNYLMQTLICVFIFYGYGLGLFGDVSRLYLLGIAVGIMVFQVAFSTAWLTYFRQGPLEWMLRRLIY